MNHSSVKNSMTLSITNPNQSSVKNPLSVMEVMLILLASCSESTEHQARSNEDLQNPLA